MECSQALHKFCSHVLNSKPTSVKADQTELQELQKQNSDTDQSRRKVLALQYRIGKKKILQSCIRKHQRLAKEVGSDHDTL